MVTVYAIGTQSEVYFSIPRMQPVLVQTAAGIDWSDDFTP